MASVLQVISAIERIANAAVDIARIVTHRLGIPRELVADLSNAEEVSHRVLVREGSPHGAPPARGPRAPGADRHAGRGDPPGPRLDHRRIDGDVDPALPGDVLFLRGSPAGITRLRELAAAPYWEPPAAARGRRPVRPRPRRRRARRDEEHLRGGGGPGLLGPGAPRPGPGRRGAPPRGPARRDEGPPRAVGAARRQATTSTRRPSGACCTCPRPPRTSATQAQQMVWLIEENEELHPILSIALGDSDEVAVARARGGGLGGRRGHAWPSCSSTSSRASTSSPSGAAAATSTGPGATCGSEADDELIASGPDEGASAARRAVRVAPHRGRRHRRAHPRPLRGALAPIVGRNERRSVSSPDGDRSPLPAVRPRPPRRRVVQGGRHRGQVPRRGRPHGPGVLHRRRGGRHPQPGHGPPRGEGRHRPRCARAELDDAAAIIGYDEVEMLGYRDCGMPDSEANANPRLLRPGAARRGRGPARRDPAPAPRPQVVVTYGDEQQGYPHPDHLRVHEITQPAVDRAADPTWYPEAGEPWQVLEDLLLGLVEEADRAHARQVPRARPRVALQRGVVRAAVAGRPHHHRRSTSRATARCATTPCSPTPPRSTPRRRSGSGCPARWSASIHPYDDYIRAASLVDAPTPGDRPVRRPAGRGPRLVAGVALPEPGVAGPPAGAASAALPERPGATARVQHVVSGAPDGRGALRPAVVDGRADRRHARGRPRRRGHPHADLRRRGADRAGVRSTATWPSCRGA